MPERSRTRTKAGRRSDTYNRRQFLRAAAVAAAAVGAAPLLPESWIRGRFGTLWAAEGAAGPQLMAQGVPAEEPFAGTWHTWVLGSGGEIRVPAPAPVHSPQGNIELAELRRLQRERTPAQVDAARYWDAGPATRRWTEIQLDMIKTHRANPVRASRGLALTHLAMYDALVTAWRAKYAYHHPAPAAVDPTLVPLVRLRGNPSYPAEHAVAAGAASRVLAHIFPQQGADWFETKAQEAAQSRIWAGADWPGAVAAGLALGRAVADRVLARAAVDGADARWDGARPSGICYWKPTPPAQIFPPLEPVWGRVQPRLLASGDQFRPGPPPACGTSAEREQMMEVYQTGRNLTEEQKRIARFWDDGPGTGTPPGHWAEIALGLVERYGSTTPRAARTFAYLGVCVLDAGICVWDAKYTYWSLRPVTYIQDYIDPNWTSLITTPPFPGYVSGHSTFSGASGQWLGHVFPQDRAALRAMAAEAALSRLLGGIHIRADNQTGLAMGRFVGALAAARALGDDVQDLLGRGALDAGEAQSLTARLRGAVAKANRKNVREAVGELQGFISQASTVLSPGAARPLVEAVVEIIAQLTVSA